MVSAGALHEAAIDDRETASATANTKAALLEAFRAQTAVPIARTKPRTLPASRKVLALAAMIALLAVPAGFAVWRWSTATGTAPAAAPEIATSVPASGTEARPAVVPLPQTVDAAPQTDSQTVPAVRSVRRSTPRRATTTATGEQARETVTEYIPLTYLDDATAMESGQVVRIDVPRSSLAAFGLPVAQDRLDERVKADIIVGDDGLARAIRFVQ